MKHGITKASIAFVHCIDCCCLLLEFHGEKSIVLPGSEESYQNATVDVDAVEVEAVVVVGVEASISRSSSSCCCCCCCLVQETRSSEGNNRTCDANSCSHSVQHVCSPTCSSRSSRSGSGSGSSRSGSGSGSRPANPFRKIPPVDSPSAASPSPP